MHTLGYKILYLRAQYTEVSVLPGTRGNVYHFTFRYCDKHSETYLVWVGSQRRFIGLIYRFMIEDEQYKHEGYLSKPNNARPAPLKWLIYLLVVCF